VGYENLMSAFVVLYHERKMVEGKRNLSPQDHLKSYKACCGMLIMMSERNLFSKPCVRRN
jgi:hypothetical protein